MVSRRRIRRSRRRRYGRRRTSRRRARPVRSTRLVRAVTRPETKHAYFDHPFAPVTTSPTVYTLMPNTLKGGASSDVAFDGRKAWLVGIKVRTHLRSSVYGSLPDAFSDLNNRIRVVIWKEYASESTAFTIGSGHINVDNVIQWKYFGNKCVCLYDKTFALDCIGQWITGDTVSWGLSRTRELRKYIKCGHFIHDRTFLAAPSSALIQPIYRICFVSDSSAPDHPSHGFLSGAFYFKDV